MGGEERKEFRVSPGEAIDAEMFKALISGDVKKFAWTIDGKDLVVCEMNEKKEVVCDMKLDEMKKDLDRLAE
jgi:hypothetical protein